MPKPKSEPMTETDEPAYKGGLDSSLDDLVGYALRRAQMKVYQHLVGRLAEHDLRPAHFTAMAIIDQNPGLMQAELAQALSVEPPQLVLIMKKLESLSVAVRVRCKPDKRSYGIFLSKKGEGLLLKLKDTAGASDVESTQALSDTERTQLLVLLRKVYRDS